MTNILGVWSFSNTNWQSSFGYSPRSHTNIVLGSNGNGMTLHLDSSNSAFLNYHLVEPGDSHTNLAIGTNQTGGSIAMWFRPAWSSSNQSGSGPGSPARLLELGTYTSNASVGWLALMFDAAGTNLSLNAQNNTGGSTNFFNAPVSLAAGVWHYFVLNYSPTNTSIFVNAQNVASGGGLTMLPGTNVLTNGFWIGSDSSGSNHARGSFDDFSTRNVEMAPSEIMATYQVFAVVYYGADFSFFVQSAPSTPSYDPVFNAIGGPGWLQYVGTASNIVTGGQMYFTNMTAVIATNQTVAWTFDIAGGTNGVLYDLFAAAPLVGGHITNSAWIWMGQGSTSNRYTVTNQPNIYSFYVMANSGADLDGDGLSDAYEMLVSRTDMNLADTDGDGISDGEEIVNGTDPNTVRAMLHFTSLRTTNTTPPGTIEVLAGIPAKMAVLVDCGTNFSGASWTTYNSNFTANLGTTDGVHEVWVGLKGGARDSMPTWRCARITLDRVAPTIVVTNPASGTTPLPMIQLQGYASETLASLSYDLTNATGNFTNQRGSPLSRHFDTNVFDFTTNWFQCFDIALAGGTNAITLHAIDRAGNQTNLQFNVTLDYSGDTNAPVLTLHWPKNGDRLSGTAFTLRGMLDDPTATVTAQIVDTNGVTNIVAGLVERDGYLWVQGLPLSPGTNALTLTLTDAATNSVTTNLNVIGSSLQLAIDAITNGQITTPPMTVTGTIDSSSYTVWVNGVRGTNNGDGTWTAPNVPFNEGGAAVIQALAIHNTDNGGNGSSNANAGNPTLADPGNPGSTNSVTASVEPEIAPYIRVKKFRAKAVKELNEDELLSSTTNTSWGYKAGGYWDVRDVYVGDVVPHHRADFPADKYPPTLTTTDYYDWNGEPYDQVTISPSAVPWPWIYSPWLKQNTKDIIPGAHSPLGFGTYEMNSQPELELVTGGRGRFNRKNLIQLAASAWNVDHFNGTELDGIVSQTVALGTLGFLGTDGMLNVMVEDNTVQPVTTEVVGNSAFAATVQDPVKPKLFIKANGIRLDPDTVATNARFIVGQPITFTWEMESTLGSVQVTNFVWSFEGVFHNAKSNAVPGGTMPTSSDVPYINTNFFTNQTQSNYWWISGSNPPATYTAALTNTLIFTNGNPQQTVTNYGKFSMFRPEATVTVLTGTVLVDTNYPVSATGGTNNDLALHFGAPAPSGTPGIVFSNSLILPAGFSGSNHWVQVVTHTLRRHKPNDGSNNWFRLEHSNVLDTTYPYPAITVSTTSDSPGIPIRPPYCLITNLVVSELLAMYLEFKPNGGEWVPLKKASWSWGGQAFVPDVNCLITDWVGTNLTWNSNVIASNTVEYPFWTNNIANLTNSVIE